MVKEGGRLSRTCVLYVTEYLGRLCTRYPAAEIIVVLKSQLLGRRKLDAKSTVTKVVQSSRSLLVHSLGMARADGCCVFTICAISTENTFKKNKS
jgi:hypothetical protein